MTVGSPVKFSDGAYGIITCGHYLTDGEIICQSGKKVGTVIKKYLGGTDGIDASLIKFDPGVKSKGSLYGKSFLGTIGPIDINSVGDYDKNKEFRLYGSKSGYCEGLAYIMISDIDYKVYDIPVKLHDALCLEGVTQGGDSGGPVYQTYKV